MVASSPHLTLFTEQLPSARDNRQKYRQVTMIRTQERGLNKQIKAHVPKEGCVLRDGLSKCIGNSTTQNMLAYIYKIIVWCSCPYTHLRVLTPTNTVKRVARACVLEEGEEGYGGHPWDGAGEMYSSDSVSKKKESRRHQLVAHAQTKRCSTLLRFAALVVGSRIPGGRKGEEAVSHLDQDQVACARWRGPWGRGEGKENTDGTQVGRFEIDGKIVCMLKKPRHVIGSVEGKRGEVERRRHHTSLPRPYAAKPSRSGNKMPVGNLLSGNFLKGRGKRTA